MIQSDKKLVNKVVKIKGKTRYIVNSYFIGTKPLRELIERLALKDAKESKINEK